MNFKYFRKMEQAGDPAIDLLGGGGTPPVDDGIPPVEPTAITEGWLTGVDAELAGDTSMGAIQDINSLVKSYIHAQKMVGKDKIVLLDEHASDDDRSAFYDKLGRPALDKYNVDFGETKYGEDFKKSFVEEAHKSGIMPAQAKQMFDFVHGQIETDSTAAAEARTTAATEAMEGLRKEWGNGFDKQVAAAQQAVNTLADDGFKTYLQESGLASDPTMIKFFAAIGGKLNEDTFDPNTVKHVGLTKDEAQDKIDSIMGNFEHPYWNTAHPGNKKAKADMLKYQESVLK